MKKAVLAIASILIIAFVAYNFFDTPHTQASNNPYEDEYYYNEDQSGDSTLMIDASGAKPEPQQNSVYTDTEPSSMTILVNKEYGLPADYVPEDLEVPAIIFSFSSFNQKKLLRKEAAEALTALISAAKEEGLDIYGVSGYRSYERQLEIYNKNVQKNGQERTDLYSARAGHSEHQTGLSMDVSTQSIHNRLELTFASTPEGKFIAGHAHEYGFILRYPKDKSDITGYAYEPWHVRYVGTELAAYLYENNLCLEEYYGYLPSESLSSDSSYGSSTDVEDMDSFNEEY